MHERWDCELKMGAQYHKWIVNGDIIIAWMKFARHMPWNKSQAGCIQNKKSQWEWWFKHANESWIASCNSGTQHETKEKRWMSAMTIKTWTMTYSRAAFSDTVARLNQIGLICDTLITINQWYLRILKKNTQNEEQNEKNVNVTDIFPSWMQPVMNDVQWRQRRNIKWVVK